jgi:EipB-like
MINGRILGGAAVAAGLVSPVLAASPLGGQMALQPHRIAYEVKLGARQGSAFSSASGVIALEFTGNACDGFVTNFRQATRLADADGAERVLDFTVNHWEAGKGDSFRFTVINKVNGQTTRDAQGMAKRVADGSISVNLMKPRGKKGDFDGTARFPTAMLQGLLAAAQKGERRFDSRLFDGSEGGEKVYETASTIGGKLEGEKNNRVESVLKVPGMEGVARWPVTTAYFEGASGDRTPVYTMKNVTFANGVVSDLQFDFADFSLTARAVRYEPLPVESCK